MLQGMKIAATWMALILAIFTLNSMGISAIAGVQMGTSGVGYDDVQGVNSDLKSPTAEGIGEQDPSFFGIATGITRTVKTIWTLLSATNVILRSWGVPFSIAASVQAMVDFTFALAVIQVWRGFKF